MFGKSKVVTLDLSNFDTNMRQMFSNSQVETLDLNSFNTSSVLALL